MTTAQHIATPTSENVPLHQVEHELARRMKAVQHLSDGPVLRACMSNLVVYCDTVERAERISEELPHIVAQHPSRVLLLIAEPGNGAGDVTARVCVRGNLIDTGRWMVAEQVTLHARSRAVERLPFAVRALLIGDLPTNLWWAVPHPPSLSSGALFDIPDEAQQIIYDSIGWLEPARGVVLTANWLAQLEGAKKPGRWRVASDLNWRRLKYWRRILSQALDPATAPGALDTMNELVVEHGPHAVIQAWELVSWLSSRLGWKVQAGRVQPNVEICWQVQTSHGPMSVRIRRLPGGPSEIRSLSIAYKVNGQCTSLRFAVDSPTRLSVTPEGEGSAPRTMSAPSLSTSELLARQLSDRDLDPVFHESMSVAQVFARSVLG